MAAWTGNTSSDWFVSGNWNPAAVPGATTDVTINNGGLAMIGAAGAVARNVRLGDNAGQSGTLNVAGGALSGLGTLTLGDFGSGVLDISGAGTVTAGSVFAGLDPGGSGTATVSGAGSKLTASSLFYAGMDAGARGQFTILNGATLTTGTTVLGYYDATATGTLTVTGATIGTGTLTIGERGIGTFNLNGGSTGTSGSVTLGSNASGNGTANIAGSGTTWATRGINIGGTGRGTLTISDGAKVTSTQSSSLAAPALVGGTATVTGAGSQWTIISNATGNPVLDTQVALGISGALIVADGGKAEIAATATGTSGNFRQIRLGGASGSPGALTVTGADASFTTPYDIWAAFNPGSTGWITVDNGGALNTGYTIVGVAGTGAALVSGANSVWTILDTPNVPSDYPHGLQIAQSATSTGSLTIADGGVVNVSVTGRTVTLGGFAGSKAAFNIGGDATGPAAAPGTLDAAAIVFVTGADSTINFNHTASDYVFAPGIQGAGPGKVNFLSGTTILTGFNTYAGTTTISSGATARFGNGGGSSGIITGDIANDGAVIFNTSSFPHYGGVISGTGTLEQRGSGTLTLEANNTYSGGTTVSNGWLQLGNGGTTGSVTGNILNNAHLAFNRSSSFTFSDVISGTGDVWKDGSGTMTLAGAATYTGGTVVSGGTLRLGASDRLASSGNLIIYGGATFDLAGFDQTVGAFSGPGTAAIGAGSLTVGNTLDHVFQGSLTGSGSFIK